jgi:hypothetical protein
MAPVKGYIKPYITLRVDIQSRQGFESPIGWTSSAGAIQEKPVIHKIIRSCFQTSTGSPCVPSATDGTP